MYVKIRLPEQRNEHWKNAFTWAKAEIDSETSSGSGSNAKMM